jgi:hypothetical protein
VQSRRDFISKTLIGLGGLLTLELGKAKADYILIDEGHAEDFSKVFVDGHEVEHCFYANAKTGEAHCHEVDENGKPKGYWAYIFKGLGHPKSQFFPECICHRGRVEIRKYLKP